MAIICLRLNAERPFASEMSEPLVGPQCLSLKAKDSLQTGASDEEARREGDYRDILNLTRVLTYGPKSKAEVDLIIERYVPEETMRGYNSLECGIPTSYVIVKQHIKLQENEVQALDVVGTRREYPWHDASATLGSGEGQIYTNLAPATERGCLMEQPYCCATARPLLTIIAYCKYNPTFSKQMSLKALWCAGAGNLRDDILYYRQELETCTDGDDEKRACLMDMGIKALRWYFFLITFRSYLYCTSANEMGFLAWIEARPELGHLCHNLRIEK